MPYCIFQLPPNPNLSSLLTVVADAKTEHIRKLIDKQKPCTKKKKPKSNQQYKNNMKNNSFSDYNSYSRQSYTNRYNRNNNVSNGNGYASSRNHSIRSSTPQNNYQRSVSSHSNMSNKVNNFHQNNFECPGRVTARLQLHLERIISENNMVISILN